MNAVTYHPTVVSGVAGSKRSVSPARSCKNSHTSGFFPTVDPPDPHAFSVPSPELMHLTSHEPVALVDGCNSAQNLTSPTRSENTAGYNYRNVGEGFENIYDSPGEDEDWLYQDSSERGSMCDSASDFTILSRDVGSRFESPVSSPTAQSPPVGKSSGFCLSVILTLTPEQ